MHRKEEPAGRCGGIVQGRWRRGAPAWAHPGGRVAARVAMRRQARIA